MADTRAYIRTQAVAASVVNVVVNPVLEWVLNRTRGVQPLFGLADVAVNLAVTSIILSALVALFASRGARRTFGVKVRGAVWRAVVMGLGAAGVVVAVLWALDRGGVAGLSFPALLVVKALYCGVLGYAVARLTLLRVLRA